MIERKGGSMDDLISRKAAIDAIRKWKRYETTEGLVDRINKLPSAQPETHEERTETHACDCISRQAAIDAILAVTGNSSVRELYEHVQEHGLSEMWSGGVNAAIDIIIAVPSAQPEIVRCKDCKHSRFFDPCFYCYEFGEEINVPENGFCFMAKRRTDA